MKKRIVKALLVVLALAFSCLGLASAAFAEEGAGTGLTDAGLSEPGNWGKRTGTVTVSETGAALEAEEGVGAFWFVPALEPVEIEVVFDISFVSNKVTDDNWVSLCFSGTAGTSGRPEEKSGAVLLFRNENGSLVCHLYSGLKFVPVQVNIQPETKTDCRFARDVRVVFKKTASGFELSLNGKTATQNGKSSLDALFQKSDLVDAGGRTHLGFGLHKDPGLTQPENVSISVKSLAAAPAETDPVNWTVPDDVQTAEGGVLVGSAFTVNKLPRDSRQAQLNIAPGGFPEGGFSVGFFNKFQWAAGESRTGIEMKLTDDGGKTHVRATYGERVLLDETTARDVSALVSVGIRNRGDSYRLELNERAVGSAKISRNELGGSGGKLYVSVTSAPNPLLVRSITSSDGVIVREPGFNPENWLDWENAVNETEDDRIELVGDTSLNEATSAYYVKLRIRVKDFAGGAVRIGFLSTQKPALLGAAGGVGIVLELTERAGEIYLDGWFNSASPRRMIGNVATGKRTGEVLEIELKNRLFEGYAVVVNGTRLMSEGDDAFAAVTRKSAATARETTFVSYSREKAGAVTELVSLSHKLLDSNPIMRLPSRAPEADSKGLDRGAWSSPETVEVNQNGTLCFTQHNILKTGLSADYVSLELFLSAFSDMQRVDTYITVALSKSAASDTAAVPAPSGVTDSLILRLRNMSGILYMDCFTREEGVFQQILSETALSNRVEGSLRLEVVRIGEETRVYINGDQVLNEYGMNPFSVCPPDLFEGEDGKTYLSFYGWNEESAQTNGLPFGRNAVCFSLTDLRDEMPDRFRDEIDADNPTDSYNPDLDDNKWEIVFGEDGDVKITEIVKEIPKEKLPGWAVALIAGGGVLAAGLAGVLAWFLICRRRENR